MKYPLRTVVPAIVLSIIMTLPVAALEKKDWKGFFSNPQLETGYFVEHPADWEAVELAPNMVGIVSPAGRKTAVSITIQDVREWDKAPAGLDEYMKVYDENIKKELPDYTVIEREKAEFAGTEAYRSVFTYTDNVDPDWHVKVCAYTFIIDGVWAYDVGYASTPDTFNDYFEVADEIMRSMRINED